MARQQGSEAAVPGEVSTRTLLSEAPGSTGELLRTPARQVALQCDSRHRVEQLGNVNADLR